MGLNFALLISQLTAFLSSGAITAEILPLAQTILQLEVTALPSPAIVGLLQSGLSSGRSLQISLLAQITNIQLEITELYSASLSSLSFTITDISASGETSQFTVSALPPSSQGVSTSLAAFQTSLAALVSVERLVQATLSLDFSAISTALTEVSITQFLVQVSSFLVELGTNVVSDNVLPLSQALLTLKINVQLSQSNRSKVQFILYLFGICERMILDIINVLSTPTIANSVSMTSPRSTTKMVSIRVPTSTPTIPNNVSIIFPRPTTEMSSIRIPTSTRQRTALEIRDQLRES